LDRHICWHAIECWIGGELALYFRSASFTGDNITTAQLHRSTPPTNFPRLHLPYASNTTASPTLSHLLHTNISTRNLFPLQLGLPPLSSLCTSCNRTTDHLPPCLPPPSPTTPQHKQNPSPPRRSVQRPRLLQMAMLLVLPLQTPRPQLPQLLSSLQQMVLLLARLRTLS